MNKEKGCIGMNKDFSDKEIMELIDKFYKEIIADSPHKKEFDCAFRERNGERHCRATTHKNCTSKCKFFQPTVMSKFKRLLTYIERVRIDNKKVSSENRAVRRMVELERQKDYCNKTWAEEYLNLIEPLWEEE